MKLKVNDVVVLNRFLKALIDDDSMKVDALVKFKLLGVMKETESVSAKYENVRESKVREYGTDQGNGTISINPEEDSFKKFQDDMNTLLQSEVEVNIVKLKPEDIFNKGIKAEYLTALYNIIDAE